MTSQTHRSSHAYSVFMPGAALVLGLMALVGGGILAATSGEWTSLLLVLLGAGAIALSVRSWGKFGVVTVDGAGIVVEQHGQKHTFEWRDVASFRTVPFVTPAVHRMSFYGSDVVVYFVPDRSAYLNLGIWVFHWSGMGKFIQERLREVGKT